MSIDFEQITADNIREYGEGTRHLELLGGLYSDRTHFIYELLQNAEDAAATNVEYHLFEDHLELRHDGRDFTERDVRGVCGVGAGTKANDITAIGRFGVGFKSVYAFTDSPTVHSADAHFKIELFVRPSAVPPISLDHGWTHIILPFDKKRGPKPAECAEDIRRGLDALDDQSLLFLSSVRQIRFEDHVKSSKASQTRSETTEDGLRRVSIALSRDEHSEVDDWLVWSRDLTGVGIPGRSVEFAIQVASPDDDGGIEPLRLEDTPLVVFFPTEKRTNLGFLLQGPFRTTPARDNVPPRDETNMAIVREASFLMVDMLLDLRDRKLLSASALSSLPLEPARFVGTMLEPLHRSVVRAFREHALIPSAIDGGYLGADEAVLARTDGLRALIDDDQLSALLGRKARWASGNFEPGFQRFIAEVLGVQSLTPERILPMMGGPFLAAQSDSWIGRLYGFLGGLPALSRKADAFGNLGPALGQPILRLSDGSHRKPLTAGLLPTAWLPSERPSRLPQIAAGTLHSEGARQYLETIGLREPDLIGELCEFILPGYADLEIHDLDESRHLDDVAAVLEALFTAGQGRDALRALLSNTCFIVGVSGATGERTLRRPQQVFVRNETTQLLLGDRANTWFVDTDLYSAYVPSLETLGVRTTITPTFRQADDRGVVSIVSSSGLHRRGLDRFDPDARCEDLEHALSKPNLDRSLWIWNNIALPFRHLIHGIVETASRKDYSNGLEKAEPSPLGMLLRESAWLPSDGAFHCPRDLELEDLPERFLRNSELANALDMQTGVLHQYSKESGIPPDLLRRIAEDPERLKRFLEFEAAAAQAALADAQDMGIDANQSDEGIQNEDPLDSNRFTLALENAFERTPKRSPIGTADPSTSGDVTNPDLRRERTAQEISDALLNQSATEERFKIVPRRTWEQKSNSTRDALQELYGGKCQICKSSFAKADGRPYFVGLYLVSYTKAPWIDRLGNVLSLCPTCSAKFQFAEVHADDLLTRVRAWRTRKEGGAGAIAIPLQLAGEDVAIEFKERHLLDLQEMLNIAPGAPPS